MYNIMFIQSCGLLISGRKLELEAVTMVRVEGNYGESGW
jgi:hypothetical protein